MIINLYPHSKKDKEKIFKDKIKIKDKDKKYRNDEMENWVQIIEKLDFLDTLNI